MRLPPLNALRAFEAAARHGGFTGAAAELFVTRGAISRHVKLLEEHLGIELFRRMPQGIELTEQGRRFAPVLADAFRNIGEGANRIAAEKSDLRIVCPPSISIRWLIPRLPQFRARSPEIRVRLTTEFFEWEDVRNREYDLGFSFARPSDRRAGIEILPMFSMVIVPACAPALLNGPVPLKKPEDLVNFVLLHETPARHDWRSWISAFKVDGLDPESGEVFPTLDMAVKAAVMGIGVVMGDSVLTREEFETGLLVMPFKELRCETDWGKFCLIGSPGSWNDPKTEAFKSWVAELAEKEARELSI